MRTDWDLAVVVLNNAIVEVHSKKFEEDMMEEMFKSYYEDMSNDSLDKFVRDRMLTYLKKNADYGDSYADAIDEFGFVAFEVMAKFKKDRIANLIKTGRREVEDEDVTQNVYDLFNYAVMTATLEETEKPTLPEIVSTCEEMARDAGHLFIEYLLSHSVISRGDDDAVIDVVGRLFPQ